MALRSIRTGASAIPEANVLQLATDLVTQSGIFNPSAGGFAITLNTNLTVAVAAGHAYLEVSAGNCYPIISDSSATVTINSNASGNPRITSVILYENLSSTPASDGSNTATLIAVDGTAAPSPSAPSGTTIQSTIGAGNPYTVLGNVTVPSGASNLSTQGTLSDQRTAVQFLVGNSGWNTDPNTWTYASASSFTVSGNQTAQYSKGTRVMCQNNGSTFFGVVISSSFLSSTTTVNLAPNADYALANSAITVPFYSYQINPQSYPGWFNYSPTWVGFSANPSSGVTRFSIVGNTCFVEINMANNGTSNGTTFTITLPVNSEQTLFIVATPYAVDNGTGQTSPGRVDLSSGSNIASFYKTLTQSSWTASGGKNAICDFFYEI